MGLYDYVRCEMPLPPDGKVPDGLFQTKSFDDPYLELYVINQAGRLIYHPTEATPKAERPHSHSDAPEGSIDSLMGCLRPSAIGTDLNYHGYLYFDDYRAKFTDGVCVEIIIDEDD